VLRLEQMVVNIIYLRLGRRSDKTSFETVLNYTIVIKTVLNSSS